MAHPELKFFNSLSGTLKIELDTPAEPVAGLLNLQASPEARVVRLKLEATVFNRKTEEFRPLTPEEYDSVAFNAPSIQLRSCDSEETITHDAPNGTHFTVRDLLHAVEETERRTRDQSEWLGGVDVHHVFFEGLHRTKKGVYEIYWGS